MDMLEAATAKKVNSSTNNAVNLAISQIMQGQTNGLTQAYDNTGNAVSLLNTSLGAMSNSAGVIQQMQSLSIEAVDGALSSNDLGNIQQGMTQLSAQLDTNATNTQYNTMQLNNGTFQGVFQIGANGGQTDTVALADTGSTALGLNNPDVTTPTAAENMIGATSNALNQVTSDSTYVGAQINGLSNHAVNLGQANINTQSAQSNYADTNMAAAISGMNQSQIQAYVSIMAMKSSLEAQQNSVSLIA
jgi:flagellin